MRKLIKAPDDVVRSGLVSLVGTGRGRVRVDLANGLVVSTAAGAQGRVGVVSGGGAGHEPLHAGFVGPGMLDVAVVGELFTSPNPEQILAAIHAADGGAGVLLIVKNYSGDVMNFDMAGELAAAEGIPVSTVVVADDLAGRDFLAPDQRRGLGGAIVVEKIAGATAAAGADLDEVTRMARRAAQGCVSHGMAATGCTLPSGARSFVTDADHYELGVGIHGEAGTRLCRISDLDPLEALLAPVVEASPQADHRLLITSGLGGSPLLQINYFHSRAVNYLTSRGVELSRELVGELVTCLDADGVTCTLASFDEELLAAWDAPVNTEVLSW